MLMKSLEETGSGKMKCFGNSMKPILTNPSVCTYERREQYGVGDIVFCKVKGRYIDAHIIVQKSDERGYLIANNHGHQNGWTRKIFGKVISSTDKNGNPQYRAT